MLCDIKAEFLELNIRLQFTSQCVQVHGGGWMCACVSEPMRVSASEAAVVRVWVIKIAKDWSLQ